MAATPRRVVAIALGFWLLTILVVIFAAPSWERSARFPYPEPFPFGEVRIGVDASFPPFALATADDLYGLEIDIGRAIAQEVHIPVRFVNLGFDGLYDVLQADQVDIVIAALQYEPSRLNDVRYTRVYFNAGLVLVSDAESPFLDMTAIPGHVLAYEFGSEADLEARRWLRRVMPFETQPYELPQYALDAVRLGEADAALVDAVSAGLYFCDHPDWRTQYTYITDRGYHIATRRDRRRTWEAVNAALYTLDGDGTLLGITNEWLCLADG